MTKFGLKADFNADGTISEQLVKSLHDSDFTPLASDRRTAYSVDLFGKEETIQADLDRMSEERAQAYMQEQSKLGNEISIEQAREKVGKFSVLSAPLSEKGAKARQKFNKALNTLNKMSGVNTSFVITDANDSFNGSVIDNRMYISAETLENDTWAKTLVHEYTHFEEGTKEYDELHEFLNDGDILVDGKTLRDKITNDVVRKGYVDGETLATVLEKIDNHQDLTQDEIITHATYISELTAHETETLLGNEVFIDKIVSSNDSLAKKIVKKIFHLEKAFEKSVGKNKAEYKQLKQAAKLYLKAAENAQNFSLVKFIRANSPDLEEEVDKTDEVRYNRKPNNKLWEKLSKKEQAQLYNHIDELHHQKFSKTKLENENYLFDVENTIVESDGKFQRPNIFSLVELKGFGFDISKARDLIYDYVNNGRTIYESVQLVNDICQKEVAIFHGQSDSSESRQGEQQGQGDSTNRGTSLDGDNGNGVSEKVRYSLKESDGNPFSDNPTEKPYFYTLSKGQVDKLLANTT